MDMRPQAAGPVPVFRRKVRQFTTSTLIQLGCALIIIPVAALLLSELLSSTQKAFILSDTIYAVPFSGEVVGLFSGTIGELLSPSNTLNLIMKMIAAIKESLLHVAIMGLTIMLTERVFEIYNWKGLPILRIVIGSLIACTVLAIFKVRNDMSALPWVLLLLIANVTLNWILPHTHKYKKVLKTVCNFVAIWIIAFTSTFYIMYIGYLVVNGNPGIFHMLVWCFITLIPLLLHSVFAFIIRSKGVIVR